MAQLEEPAALLNLAPGGKLRCCDPLGCHWEFTDQPIIPAGTVLNIEIIVLSCQKHESRYCGEATKLRQVVTFVALGAVDERGKPMDTGLIYSTDSNGGDLHRVEFRVR